MINDVHYLYILNKYNINDYYLLLYSEFKDINRICCFLKKLFRLRNVQKTFVVTIPKMTYAWVYQYERV